MTGLSLTCKATHLCLKGYECAAWGFVAWTRLERGIICKDLTKEMVLHT